MMIAKQRRLEDAEFLVEPADAEYDPNELNGGDDMDDAYEEEEEDNEDEDGSDEEEEDSDEEDEDGDDEDDEDDSDGEDEEGSGEENGEDLDDGFALQLLEEELDEIEDELSPEELDELEQLLSQPEDPASQPSDDEKWNVQGDDQILPQSVEFQTDDDTFLEHETESTDDAIANQTMDLTKASVHKNGIFVVVFLVLAFSLGIMWAKMRANKKKSRRHIPHKRLHMDDDDFDSV